VDVESGTSGTIGVGAIVVSGASGASVRGTSLQVFLSSPRSLKSGQSHRKSSVR
jgi:hypothetical protein